MRRRTRCSEAVGGALREEQVQRTVRCAHGLPTREALTDVNSEDPEIRDYTCGKKDLAYFRNGANFPLAGAMWWRQRGGRVGIQRTLHRLAGAHYQDELIGVKIRIGRAVGGGGVHGAEARASNLNQTKMK